jgi:alcohol dehydrogenase, propanol-preferring
MRAMVLERLGEELVARDLPDPVPGEGEALVEVEACGVCRTDLHVCDGELPDPSLPLVPGHQAVGTVVATGAGAEPGVKVGDRVGVPWLGWTCGACEQCLAGRENLCARARFTGYSHDGGFAERLVADSRYCFPLPAGDPLAAAPLLCAGLIGYRALRMCGGAERVGLYGFGSSAHIICQLLAAQGREAYAFTRPGDETTGRFARSLGAVWAGGSGDPPPQPLGAAIVFAPVGALVPLALRAVAPGGTVVCAGIHMSDIPSFPYEDLWMERSIRTVANLTRRDGEELLPLAAELGIRPRVVPFPLERANEALADLREGRLEGSAVLVVGAGAQSEMSADG